MTQTLKKKMHISDLSSFIWFFPLMASAMHCGSCSLTLQALCTGIVHRPTDQRHGDAEQYEEDPIFSQPVHEESLDPRDTVCKTQTSNAHTKNPSSIELSECQDCSPLHLE